MMIIILLILFFGNIAYTYINYLNDKKLGMIFNSFASGFVAAALINQLMK